jgi:hypothetical protein
MPRHKKQTKRTLVLVTAALLVAGAVALGVLRPWQTAPKASQDIGINDVKTREEESEGTTFPVPVDTPEDAIKNYELVTENEEYKIRRDSGSNSYIITLYAIINRPDQYDMYREQLREYKQHALDYLTDKGVNVSQVTITYEPEEATNL